MDGAGATLEQFGDFTRGLRLAEQVTLDFRASRDPELFELFDGFFALRRGLHSQRLGQCRHGKHNGRAIIPCCHFSNEGLVDLDLVERKFTQVAQGRVSGSKVIERYTNA